MKRLILIYFFSLCFNATAYKIHYISANKAKYVQLAGLAKYYGYRHQKMKNHKERLSSSARNFIFSSKSKFFLEDETRLYLSYTPKMHQGNIYIHQNDFYQFLDPLLRHKGVSPKQKAFRILIDPGHGGRDSGTVGKQQNEKSLNLSLSLKLKKMLEELGYKVFLTRWSDRFPSFKERTGLIKKFNADLFISIHHNAAGDRSVSGIETFHLTPRGGISSNGGKKARWGVTAGDPYSRESALLAYAVHKQFAKYTGSKNRGVKKANFKVLRDSACPSILIEAGFLSNRWEEGRLISNSYQKRLVDCIARGLQLYRLRLKH